jgi:hypothetical protein
MRPRPEIAFLLAACSSTSSYDSVTARWDSRAPVPDARTEVSVAAGDSLIYLIGGYGRGEGRRPAAPRGMLAYDPATDRWAEPVEIPEGLNHATLAAVGGRLYIIGGFRGSSSSPTGAVRIYDPATGTWRDGAPMPTARGALAVAVLDGRIHTVGGNAAGGVDLEPHEHGAAARDRSVGTHEVYDPAQDTWTRLEPMLTARNHLGAAAIDGKIHVVGGRVPGDMELTTHEIYDPATDTWAAGPAMPTGRSGIAVVAHRNRLYVFGGETIRRFSSKTFDDAERFDPATGRWEVLPPMPTARHGLGAASLGDAIYVLSGGPRPRLTLGVANERLTALP